MLVIVRCCPIAYKMVQRGEGRDVPLATKRRCLGSPLSVARSKRFIWSIVGTYRAPARWSCTMAKPVVISLLAVLATGPAVAKDLYPISVPGECYELAQREGVPAVISNRYEAAKAKVKLARLRDTDPMVHECRQAVNRARQSIIQASE